MARNLDIKAAGPQTLAIHAGEHPDPATGASSPNIVMSSTFVTDKPEGFSAYELTEDSPFVYSRWANPTVRQLEQIIRQPSALSTFLKPHDDGEELHLTLREAILVAQKHP